MTKTMTGVMVALAATVGLIALAVGGVRAGQGTQAIELTPAGCQFVERENGLGHGYQTIKQAGCAMINQHSGDRRLAASRPLELKPSSFPRYQPRRAL